MNANQTKEFGGNQIDRNQLNSTTSLCKLPVGVCNLKYGLSKTSTNLIFLPETQV